MRLDCGSVGCRFQKRKVADTVILAIIDEGCRGSLTVRAPDCGSGCPGSIPGPGIFYGGEENGIQVSVAEGV